jgi:hypothetical protein
VVAGAGAPANVRLPRAASRRRAARIRSPRLGDRGQQQLRRRARPLPRRARRGGARGQSHAANRAALARQRRRTGRGHDRAGRARQREARASADRCASQGVTAVAARASQRRRRQPRNADATTRRHCHRRGAASPGAARALRGQVARPLQPLPPLRLSKRRRACVPARAPRPCPSRPGGDRRGPRARTRDPRAARARAGTARRARCGTSRRRPADRRLFAPRSRPSRSRRRE